MANVLVNNLCSWDLGFRRYSGVGEIVIPANAKNYPSLSFEEIQMQIQNNNRMFTGTDGLGSHARIQIVDEEQRRKLFGLDESGVQEEQMLLTVDAVKSLLAIRGKAKFKAKLAEMVQTNAERRVLLDVAKDAGAENAEAWKMEELRKASEIKGI